MEPQSPGGREASSEMHVVLLELCSCCPGDAEGWPSSYLDDDGVHVRVQPREHARACRSVYIFDTFSLVADPLPDPHERTRPRLRYVGPSIWSQGVCYESLHHI